MSEINLSSYLSKGPIIEKLLKRSLSKPASSGIEGKEIEEGRTKVKSSDKSLLSKQSDDLRDKQGSPNSKDPMIILKPRDIDLQKNMGMHKLKHRKKLYR